MADPDEKPTPPFGKLIRPAAIQDPPSELGELARSARDTAQITNRTLDRVDSLRQEVGRHLARQDRTLAVLAEHVAGVDGKLDILIGIQQGEHAITVTSMKALIEVEKTGGIAKIEDDADRKRHRRELVLKFLAIAGPIVSAAIGLAAGRC